jgi:hypothetical protein
MHTYIHILQGRVVLGRNSSTATVPMTSLNYSLSPPLRERERDERENIVVGTGDLDSFYGNYCIVQMNCSSQSSQRIARDLCQLEFEF